MSPSLVINPFPPAKSRLPDIAPASPPTTVFMPKEHGSWSLALEPLVLGLLLAPSAAGGALAVATLAGFFARRPLRTLFVSPSALPRAEAVKNLLFWVVLGLAALGETGLLGNVNALWPLLPAGLLAAVFVWQDAHGRARTTTAELCGCAAFSLVPATLATLAGWPALPALALATLAFARGGPAVLLVREQTRLAKGRPADGWFALPAAAVMTAVIAAMSGSSLLPWAVIVPVSLLLIRAAWFTGPWRPRLRPRKLGIFEATLGVGYLAGLWVAFRW